MKWDNDLGQALKLRGRPPHGGRGLKYPAQHIARFVYTEIRVRIEARLSMRVDFIMMGIKSVWVTGRNE